MNLEQQRIEILQSTNEAREREVLHYQINIDNYCLAINEIDENYSDHPEMLEFRKHLQYLLQSALTEQLKEKIMLNVTRKQLEGLTCTSE